MDLICLLNSLIVNENETYLKYRVVENGRKQTHSTKWEISRLLFYNIYFKVSFVINLFVVAVFAHGLYGKTNHEIVSSLKIHHLLVGFPCWLSCVLDFLQRNHFQFETCNATAGIPDRHAFPDNDEPAESDIYKVT